MFTEAEALNGNSMTGLAFAGLSEAGAPRPALPAVLLLPPALLLGVLGFSLAMPAAVHELRVACLLTLPPGCPPLAAQSGAAC